MAAGEMEVPRLRTGCRATQVPTEDEAQVVATAVGAEESRPTLGKRGQGGGKKQGRGNATGRRKNAKTQQRHARQFAANACSRVCFLSHFSEFAQLLARTIVGQAGHHVGDLFLFRG